MSSNQGTAGTIECRWLHLAHHRSGKTLTSFKTAQAQPRRQAGRVAKVLFVVDRKDLDYQTKCEYERFEKGAVDGTRNTAHLKRRLEYSDRESS